MPFFNVYGTVIGSKYLGCVEAATAEDAIFLASEREGVSMCYQCSSECEDPAIDVDLSTAELTDDPNDIKAARRAAKEGR